MLWNGFGVSVQMHVEPIEISLCIRIDDELKGRTGRLLCRELSEKDNVTSPGRRNDWSGLPYLVKHHVETVTTTLTKACDLPGVELREKRFASDELRTFRNELCPVSGGFGSVRHERANAENREIYASRNRGAATIVSPHQRFRLLKVWSVPYFCTTHLRLLLDDEYIRIPCFFEVVAKFHFIADEPEVINDEHELPIAL